MALTVCQISCFYVSCFFTTVFSLRVTDPSADLGAVGDSRIRTECTDDEQDSIISPIVEATKTFFHDNDMQIFPFAVSAVGALRYGANIAVHNGRRYVIDDDVDFFVGGRSNGNLTDHDVDKLLGNFESFLTKKFRKHGVFAKLEINDRKMFSMVRDWKLGGTLKWDLGEVGRISSRDQYGNEYLQTGLNIFNIKGNALSETYRKTAIVQGSWAVGANIGEKTNPFVEGLAHLTELYKPGSAGFPRTLHVDIFYARGDQTRFASSSTKKVLFHGVSLDYPEDEQFMHEGLFAAFWSDGARGRKTTNMCEFLYPDAIYYTDCDQSEHSAAVSEFCTKQLRTLGFESLSHCIIAAVQRTRQTTVKRSRDCTDTTDT